MRDARLNSFWDRRLAKRNRAALKVYLLDNSVPHRGTTSDISRRGAFVETGLRGFVIGTLIDLAFVQQSQGVISLSRYTAVVVRHTDRGLGVRFCWSSRLERIGNVKLSYGQERRG